MSTKHIPAPPPTLEERIAKALGRDDLPSDEIAILIAEAEQAASAADAPAQREHAAALDPAMVIDAAVAGWASVTS